MNILIVTFALRPIARVRTRRVTTFAAVVAHGTHAHTHTITLSTLYSRVDTLYYAELRQPVI